VQGSAREFEMEREEMRLKMAPKSEARQLSKGESLDLPRRQ